MSLTFFFSPIGLALAALFIANLVLLIVGIVKQYKPAMIVGIIGLGVLVAIVAYFVPAYTVTSLN